MANEFKARNGVIAPAVILPGSTSGTITVQAPSTAGTQTLTLPSTTGSNGQALTTNGSGTLSWGSFVGTTGDQTADGNKTFSNITTLNEIRYVNSNVQKFSQIYSGGATGSYFDSSDWQEVCTVTPSGDSQNYQIIGRVIIQSGGNVQIINFQAALRSGTLPDLSWSITFDEEVVGGTRYANPVLWVKETTTAAFKFALKGLSTVFGTISVDVDVIHRLSTTYSNVVFNTTKISEVSAIPTDYTEYAFTENDFALTTGNVATATALQTTRTLWGQNFNGSANVSGALSSVTTLAMSGQLTNTVAIGTAPFVVTSTTRVANLNVATAGTADNVTGTVAIANGGTGEITRQAAMDALAGAVTSGQYLRGNGTDVVMSAIQAGDVPILNQNTTGTASNVTGTVAVANGGTGATTAPTARTNLGATTVGSNLFTLTNPSAVTFPRFNADNTVSTLDAATFRTAIGAGTSSTTGTVTSVGGTGTVSGLTLTGTVTGSGNLTLGGTLAVTASNFASQTANTFLAAPNGSAGVPTFRALVAADVPTLNQNTTGSAATLTTTRTLWGQNFNGSANVSGNLTSVGNITGTAGVTLTATSGTLALAATGANVITASTNATERFRIDANGLVGFGGTPSANSGVVRLLQNATGNTVVRGVVSDMTVQSDVTTAFFPFRSQATTAASTFTLGNLTHFSVAPATFGAGSVVTTQTGYSVDSSMTGATNNYAFRGQLASATGRYNLYMDGTANNFLHGATIFSGILTSNTSLNTANNNGDVAARVTIDGSTVSTIALRSVNTTTARFASSITFKRNRGPADTPTTISSGDTVGRLDFQGYEGTNYVDMASITVSADGTPATESIAGRIIFNTTSTAASTPSEKFRINSEGAIGLGGANYGTAGQVLTSNGSASAPTWQTVSGGGGGSSVSTYTTTIGNGSATSITVTHNLAKNDILVTVREVSTGYIVYPDVDITSTNALVIEFVTAPTTNQYRVSVIGF